MTNKLLHRLCVPTFALSAFAWACASPADETLPSNGGSSSASAGGGPLAGSPNGATGGTSSSAGTAGSPQAGATGGSATSTAQAGGGGASASAGSASGGSAAGSAGASGGVSGGAANDCTGHLFCDDFEQGAKGSQPRAPWKTRISSGQVSYDDSKAASGKYSMKFSQTSGADRRALMVMDGAPAFPLQKNTLYARFMFYTDKPPTPGVHATFVWGEGKYLGVSTKYSYGFHDKLIAVYFRGTNPSTECWQHKQPSQLPTGKWQCIAVEFNGETNEARFALGAADVPELHVQGLTRTTDSCVNKNVDPKWYAPNPFTAVVLGWETYGQEVAHDTWIDDVVLDDKPVPCAP